MRDELLNETQFFILRPARWVDDYDTQRPRSSLRYPSRIRCWT
jgi:hypothetical protein